MSLVCVTREIFIGVLAYDWIWWLVLLVCGENIAIVFFPANCRVRGILIFFVFIFRSNTANNDFHCADVSSAALTFARSLYTALAKIAKK